MKQQWVSWHSVLVLSCLLLCNACQRDTPATTSLQPQTLVRGNGPEPESLDPQKARQDSSLNILRDLYEGLTTLDASAQPVPGAAQSWTISADARRYRFT